MAERVRPGTAVAGLPLVRRIVLAAARAGFADIRVHKALAGAEDLLAGTRAATLTADEPDTPRAARRIVIVPANIVPQPRWLRSLLEAELRPDTLYVDPSLAAVIESADPAQARGRRDPDTSGQLDVGHPPIGQQVPQYAAVDPVESDSPHPVPSSSIGGS